MGHLETVRDFVVENFLFGDGDQMQTDTSFMESGIIDSTGILELITFLEATYQISIQDEELVPENLDSLDKINSFLQKKLVRHRSMTRFRPNNIITFSFLLGLKNCVWHSRYLWF